MTRVDAYRNGHAYGILIFVTDPKSAEDGPTFGSVEAAFGVLVREWRLAAGLSQSAVALRMVDLGFTAWVQSTVSQTEAGGERRPLRLNEFWALCHIFEQRPVPVIRALEIGTGDDRERRIGALRAALAEGQRVRQQAAVRLAQATATNEELEAELTQLLNEQGGEDVG